MEKNDERKNSGNVINTGKHSIINIGDGIVVNLNDKDLAADKMKVKWISIGAGAITSVLFLALGLILAYCVPIFKDSHRDTVFFVIECVKDILAGLGGGVATYGISARRHNTSKKCGKLASITGFVVLALAMIGAVIVLVLACFSIFGNWGVGTYLLLEVGFILLALISCACIFSADSE